MSTNVKRCQKYEPYPIHPHTMTIYNCRGLLEVSTAEQCSGGPESSNWDCPTWPAGCIWHSAEERLDTGLDEIGYRTPKSTYWTICSLNFTILTHFGGIPVYRYTGIPNSQTHPNGRWFWVWKHLWRVLVPKTCRVIRNSATRSRKDNNEQ